MNENWNSVKEQFLTDIEKNANGKNLIECLGLDSKHSEKDEPILEAISDEFVEKQPGTVSEAIQIILKHSPSLGEFAFFLTLIMRKLERKRIQEDPIIKLMKMLEKEM